jgi:hypothetical protein
MPGRHLGAIPADFEPGIASGWLWAFVGPLLGDKRNVVPSKAATRDRQVLLFLVVYRGRYARSKRLGCSNDGLLLISRLASPISPWSG